MITTSPLNEDKMTIKNMTGHDLNVNGTIIPADDVEGIIRLGSPNYLYSKTIDGMEVAIYDIPETLRLPEYKRGTYYIVSRSVAEYNRNRSDLLVPDTTKHGAVRLPTGEIFMVTRLSSLYRPYIKGEKGVD